MYTGVFFKRYILGLWAMAEGIIYDMFDADKHVQKITDFFRRLKDGERYVSCDYGTQNATVFLLWNKGNNGKLVLRPGILLFRACERETENRWRICR